MENNEPIDVFAVNAKVETPTVVGSAIQKFSMPKHMAVELQSRFEPFEKLAKEWEIKAKALVVTDVNQKDLMAEARKARLALRQIRLDVTKLHEQEKADALRTSQLLDTIKRTLLGYIEPLEDHLQAQEDFAKVQEEKRKQELLAARMEALKPYRTPGDFLERVPFGEMDDGAFETFLMGLQASKELREAKAKEDERLRQEAEQKAKDEREKAKKEAERLNRTNHRIGWVTGKMGLAWDEEMKRYQFDDIAITMQDINDLNTQEFQELINELLPKVKDKKEAIIKKQQEQEAELQRQREALQKLETEKREREEKEEKERKEKAAADRKLKRAPDKIKLLNLAERIELIEPITLKDDLAKGIYTNAVERLAQLVKDIKLQCEQL